MQYPGEYSQPLTRTTELRVPVVNGCKTARIKATYVPPISLQGTTVADTASLVRVTNVGSTAVTVQFEETDNYTTGPFTDIGGSLAVPIGGQRTTTLFPKHPYLQVRGTSGTGMVNISIASQVRFTEMGFDKSDGAYPTSLWQANYTSWNNL